MCIIVDEIEKQLKDWVGLVFLWIEGCRDLMWVFFDFGVLVVYIFSEEMRCFYDIECLYRDVF